MLLLVLTLLLLVLVLLLLLLILLLLLQVMLLLLQLLLLELLLQGLFASQGCRLFSGIRQIDVAVLILCQLLLGL